MTSKVIQVQKILNKNISEAIGKDKKFTMLLASEPFSLPKEEHRGFNERYEKIKEFFTITNSLVYKALFHKTKEAKELYTLIFSGKKQEIINEQRLWYKNEKNPLPLFFRTDESQPGIITEIQCPGSGIAQVGELQKAWEQVLGKKLWPDWDRQIVKDIIKVTKKKNPKLIYLPRSSCVEDILLFIKKTTKYGINYTSFNPKSKKIPQCDMIKNHSYTSLRKNPFFTKLFIDSYNKKTIIDVPPVLILDMKLIFALPFYLKTKDYYPNYIKNLFPKTNIIKLNETIIIEDTKFNYEEYCSLPESKRNHVIKYAGGFGKGTSGGKKVFTLKTSKKNCRILLKKSLQEYQIGKSWIIQPIINKRQDYSFLSSKETIEKENGYTKFSGFYGPNGLIMTNILLKNFYKVNASESTSCAPILFK